MTYENIINALLENAPNDVDTREGSIYHDAVNAFALRCAEMFMPQAVFLYEQLQLETATGEALDIIGSERLVSRKSASKAEYAFIYEGEVPPLGSMFYSEDGTYFTLMQYDDGLYYLESVETGTENNNVVQGTKAVPTETFTSLKAASFGELLIQAIDDETDEQYRQSIIDSIVPGENGNIQHYKDWCKEADSSVGQARIFPCYDGPNTVVAFITGADGLPASDELIAKVQRYVDPDDDGDGIGDGLGEGAANIGAHFRAVSSVKATIPITIIGLVITDGYTFDDVTENVKSVISEYFKELSLSDEKHIVIKSSVVGAKIQALDCVDSFISISLQINTAPNTYTHELYEYEIPIVGKVAQK